MDERNKEKIKKERKRIGNKIECVWGVGRVCACMLVEDKQKNVGWKGVEREEEEKGLKKTKKEREVVQVDCFFFHFFIIIIFLLGLQQNQDSDIVCGATKTKGIKVLGWVKFKCPWLLLGQRGVVT